VAGAGVDGGLGGGEGGGGGGEAGVDLVFCVRIFFYVFFFLFFFFFFLFRLLALWRSSSARGLRSEQRGRDRQPLPETPCVPPGAGIDSDADGSPACYERDGRTQHAACGCTGVG